MNKNPSDAIYMRISPNLRKRIDDLRRKQTIRPTLVETVRSLIERGLDQIEDEEANDHRS